MNNYNPNIHHRKSIRMKGYDYSKKGLYFITICTAGRKCLFGKIVPVGVQNFEPQRENIQPRRNEYQKIIPRSIGSIVRGFKIGVTKWFRNNTDIENIWQRDYYEHIIRNEHAFKQIAHNIIENPKNWKNDNFF